MSEASELIGKVRTFPKLADAPAPAVLAAPATEPSTPTEVTTDTGASVDASGESATWTPCDPKVVPSASVRGFSMRRHTSGLVRLWRDAMGDKPACMVGAPLWLLGLAADEHRQGWSAVVDFTDLDGARRRWLMPRSMLAGDARDLLRALLDQGYDPARGREPRDALSDYVAGAPRGRFTTTLRTGWHGDSFVLPDRVVGPGTYLLATPPNDRQPPAGTLDGWRKAVAMPCRGNTRLTFALSCGLSSPLLKQAGMESGGFHFVGDSSSGKTTGLRVARSPWGHKPESWRATDNALESVAAGHDGIGLILDEIAQVDGRKAGEIAYLIANGQGKARATKDGGNRVRLQWLLHLLSSGEKTLAQHMGEAGQQAKAGQVLRLANIEADAGASMGLFENTHGLEPAAFADSLMRSCDTQHGHAGPAFIESLIGNKAEAQRIIETVRGAFEVEVGLGGADGQVCRVARRFALVAAAGELATGYGLTGWTKGAAIGAAVVCFESWRKSWAPTGSHEEARAVEQVRAFLQGQAFRLDPYGLERDDAAETRTRDRIGFVREHDGQTEYLIFRQAFDDEVCTGLNPTAVRKTLAQRGLLRESGGKFTVTAKPASLPRKARFVAILDTIHDDGEPTEGNES